MELRKRLAALPRSTANRRGTATETLSIWWRLATSIAIINGFGARWDETETISLNSCWRTFKAFSLGSEYPLFPRERAVCGRTLPGLRASERRGRRSTRGSICGCGITPLRFQAKPVWIGQISRDIGVRFTLKTWNLTTHKIDPNVDDARDYLLNDLLQSGRVALLAYVPGAEAANRSAPRRNLTGDPYFTDGLRAVAILSESLTTPMLANWA